MKHSWWYIRATVRYWIDRTRSRFTGRPYVDPRLHGIRKKLTWDLREPRFPGGTKTMSVPGFDGERIYFEILDTGIPPHITERIEKIHTPTEGDGKLKDEETNG